MDRLPDQMIVSRVDLDITAVWVPRESILLIGNHMDVATVGELVSVLSQRGVNRGTQSGKSCFPSPRNEVPVNI